MLNIPQSFSIFKDVFLALRKLYFLYNKDEFHYNYQRTIDDFCSTWFNLTDMFSDSKTKELHILIDHFEDYLEMTDATLIKLVTNVVKTCTSTSIKGLMYSLYLVKDVINLSLGQRLFRAVRHLNSYNMYLRMMKYFY